MNQWPAMFVVGLPSRDFPPRSFERKWCYREKSTEVCGAEATRQIAGIIA
jgi:hypothetical protein